MIPYLPDFSGSDSLGLIAYNHPLILMTRLFWKDFGPYAWTYKGHIEDIHRFRVLNNHVNISRDIILILVQSF